MISSPSKVFCPTPLRAVPKPKGESLTTLDVKILCLSVILIQYYHTIIPNYAVSGNVFTGFIFDYTVLAIAKWSVLTVLLSNVSHDYRIRLIVSILLISNFLNSIINQYFDSQSSIRVHLNELSPLSYHICNY